MYQGSALLTVDAPRRETAQFTNSIEFSSSDFAPIDQFPAFRAAHRGVIELSGLCDTSSVFPARQKVWNLDRMAFMRTTLPGSQLPHRRSHPRTCSIDHWYINLPFDSRSGGNGHRKPHDTRPAVPELHYLKMPHERTVHHDGLLTLFIPPDLFSSTICLHRMLDLRFEGGLGKLLADYLFLLDRSLEDLLSPEIPYIVEATRSLVAVCLAPSQKRIAGAQIPIDATLLGRARRVIDERLTDRNLSPEMLCATLGVSRSRLYRIFEPLGGIATYVRKQRLSRTRDALSNTTDTRSISRIAEEWGFVDPSTYSRMFRQEFGISPKEARDIGWASNGFVVTPHSHIPSSDKQTLLQLLRTVEGT